MAHPQLVEKQLNHYAEMDEDPLPSDMTRNKQRRILRHNPHTVLVGWNLGLRLPLDVVETPSLY